MTHLTPTVLDGMMNRCMIEFNKKLELLPVAELPICALQLLELKERLHPKKVKKVKEAKETEEPEPEPEHAEA